MRLARFLAVSMLGIPALLSAQAQAPARKPPVRRVAPPPPPPTTDAADVTCPTPLGVGVSTKLAFCDVLSSRTPAEGVLVRFPPHRGPVTLSFDLHNRHTYSEEQVRANRAYAHYTATIGVMTMDNTLVKRAAVDSEFRTAKDFIDRIGGGVGPGGLKAVGPTGVEHISVVVPMEEDGVSLLGEKLTVVDRAGQTATYTSPGRPIAIVSNVMVEDVPAPPVIPRSSGAPPKK
jgi:hypothetical protein